MRRHGTIGLGHAGMAWLAGGLLTAAGWGCVAVNVGQPVSKFETKRFEEEAETPTRTRVLAVRPVHGATWKSIRVGLGGDLRDEYRRSSYTVSTGHLEQKRLAFGLFPGAAEEYALPRGAEKHTCYKPDYPSAFILGALPAGLFVGLGTVHSLLLELPFGSYDCWQKKQTEGFSHLGLAGFHKYTAIIPRPPERSPDREEPSNFKDRKGVPAVGPYEVSFRIDGLGYSGRKTVKAGEDGVSFDLPTVGRDYEGEALVAFRRVPGVAPLDQTSSLMLSDSQDKVFRFTLFLHPPPKPPPKPETKPSSPPPVTRPVPSPPPPRPAPRVQALYEIAGIEPLPDGQYSIRIRVKDRQKTFSIGWQVEEDVKALIRQDYLGRHPRVAEAHVREIVQWNMARDGDILVLTAWAFSVQPVTDGWSYDAESHRGFVRLRISEGMSAAEAKQWAHDNIEAIIEDKNIVVVAGIRPPPGAKYRSLDEEFRNGVLTVEFVAEE
ncbi:MAG: hypothetical protein J6Y19_08505 [Kiritimatiellae bacterium]|nr:hypothetical protein [Kiritimatiellia bacterium]